MLAMNPFKDDMVFKKVSTEVIRMAVQSHLSRHCLENLRFDTKAMIDNITGDMVFQLVAGISGKQEKTEVSYPADWWQALRQRWFPRWWLKRHPVQFKRIVTTTTHLCPHLPIGEHRTQHYHLQWLMKEESQPDNPSLVTLKIPDHELFKWLDNWYRMAPAMPSDIDLWGKYPFDPEQIPIGFVAEKVAPKRLMRVVQRRRNHWEGMSYIECEVMS